jgi:hypothetical protein
MYTNANAYVSAQCPKVPPWMKIIKSRGLVSGECVTWGYLRQT